jgi:tetratricopeptide (TPR) repeat protein
LRRSEPEISPNPKDTASLQPLGDIYFAALEYKNASFWEQKVLGIDSTNQVALLALGAAQFNLGNSAEAKKQWLLAKGSTPRWRRCTTTLGFLHEPNSA